MAGVDFASDPNQATVRVNLKWSSPQSGAAQFAGIASENWVWERNNWYLDMGEPRSFLGEGRDKMANALPFANGVSQPDDTDQLRKEAESKFTLLDTSVDFGTLIQGDSVKRLVRFEYTGDVSLRVESGLPSDAVLLDGISTQAITARSKEFGIMMNTDDLGAGPFSLPLPLNIRYKGITITRSVMVSAQIVTPLTVTQSPSPLSNLPANEVRLTLRNNTTENLDLASVSSNGLFSASRLPESIPPNGEGTLVLRLSEARPAQNAQVVLNFSRPVLGRTSYAIKVRLAAAP